MNKLSDISRYECDDCKEEFPTWAAVWKHLAEHPDHAPEGDGLVNVYRRGENDFALTERVTITRIVNKEVKFEIHSERKESPK